MNKLCLRCVSMGPTRRAIRLCVLLALVSGRLTDATSTGQEASTQKPSVVNEKLGAGELIQQRFGKLSPDQLKKMDEVQVDLGEEIRYGRRLLAARLKQMGLESDDILDGGDRREYVSYIVENVNAMMRNRDRYPAIELSLVYSDMPFAFSTPGGYLYVSTALISWTENQDEIHGAIAHCLSHLDHGHEHEVLKVLKLQSKTLDDLDETFIDAIALAPLSIEQEIEADADAARWLAQANGQVARYTNFLERCAKQPAVDKLTRLRFSQNELHPYSSQRALRLANPPAINPPADNPPADNNH